MSTETVRYVDTPVELEIDGRRCQYAPMRMEWSFDPDAHPLEEQTLEFDMRDEEASVLQIHMTEACNLRCTYCSHFLNPKKGSGALTEDEIEMLLERIRALPEDGTLILHGGEPFLQAEATLRFAEASPCTAVIFTNGTLLTEQILDRLRGITEEYRHLNVLNYEMEAGTLFKMAGVYGFAAACVCGVIAQRTASEKVILEQKGQAVENAIKVAIRALELS